MKIFAFLGCMTAAAVASMASAQSSTTIYSTGFNSGEGYVAGDINGQNGWTTYQPGAGSGYANVTFTAPPGFGGDGALQINSGTDASTSPRYAWPTGYGSTWDSLVASNGYDTLRVKTSMYLASGSASTARLGLVSFDSTGSKILSGFYVQQSTGVLYMLGYYNNAGTLNNYAFNTGVTLGFNSWVDITTTWNRATGRFEVFWGSNGFYVDGAGAGSTADETDFYVTRNGSAISTTAYFDNLSIEAVPAPGAIALLGLAGLAGRRRRA